MKLSLTIKCYDCNKEIKIKNKELVDAKQLVYKDGDKKIAVLKCNECYDKDQSLRNYQPCEVYSRIVGYLRPIRQWNVGKREEYKDRVNYETSQIQGGE